MPRFSPTPAPTDTPWGAPGRAAQILPGIWEISTPSHGGMILSEERQAALPGALRRDTICYEEDVDWSLVVLAFEAEFSARPVRGSDLLADNARASVKAWYSGRYSAFTGEAVAASESHVLRRRAAYAARIDEYVVVSAWGDWADWVPEDKIGVAARRVARVDALGFAAYEGEPIHGLVDKDRYDNSREVKAFDEIGAVRVASTAPLTKEIVL